MTGISYEDLADRLTPEATDVLRDMVRLHLEAGSGDRFFIESRFLGQHGASLDFVSFSTRGELDGVDGGALQDLGGYGLLHVDYSSRGTPNYRVSGEGLHFYRWLMEQEGSPFAQTETAVMRLLSGDRFAAEHPSAARHLGEAFRLLWSDDRSDAVVSEIGDHLRKALMDVTSDVVGEAGGDQEKPIERLNEHIRSKPGLSEREQDVLVQTVELARVTLRLDQRLNHIRDEKDKGKELMGWHEVRRAAFVTALVVSEISEL